MQRITRRLAFVISVSLLLQSLLLAPVGAQQTAQQIDDSDAPKFLAVSPAKGTVIAGTTVTITGHIDDASPVEVAVDDFKTKTDKKGGFTLKDVPLKIGKNSITLVATDEAGNSEEFELELIGKDLVPPVAPVVFAIKPITRLSYEMIEGYSEPESRVVISGGAKVVLAEAAYGTGLFTAFVRLREGKNDLTVVALDDAGASPPVRISIERTGAGTPLPLEGEPSQINISSGATQRALPGTEFARPLVASVTDVRGLPVKGVAIEFTVRFGDARFAGGLARHVVRTDDTGHASVRLSAGKNLGIHLIRADFEGNTSSPAAFDIETVPARGDNQTTVSGILLDIFSHPLENTTVRLGKRTAKTQKDGRFSMPKVQPGNDQRLEVMGADVNSGGYLWTGASYPIDVLPGAENSLGRPLFVSPLNEGAPLSAVKPFVLDPEGRVTSDGVLVWHSEDGREDFQEAEVSLLRGVRVSATPPAKIEGQKFAATHIFSGKVPVALTDGLVTSNYYFVSPHEVELDPPLPFKIHNSDSIAPGARVLIMHFDLKAGRWLKEGTAHISDDGKVIINDEGSGIRGGGWYAFPGQRTHPEFTSINFMQIEGDPNFEGKAIINLEVYFESTSAVMASSWGDYEFKRLHFRNTVAIMNGEILVDNKGIEARFPSDSLAVSVTPGSHTMYPGDSLILYAAGRPHPGGNYIWASSDPSIASVEPMLNDGGAEHPNRAKVITHRLGTAKITVTYVTPGGATEGTATIVCYPKKPR